MADYGHELLFGTFLTPRADRAEQVVALARLTDQAGLDLVTIQDHPYQARFLDTWTLLSVIAASTTTVRVAPNVANLPLRPPAVLARAAASLDLLTGGRVELGLGAGAFWDGVAAMGGTRLRPAQAVQALDEAIRVIRAIWAPGGTVRVDGEHHRVWGAHAGPAPAHDIGIWVGAYKPRMLALTGRLGDGWLPSSMYAGPEELPAMNAVIDEAAEEAGRRPGDVRRLYNIAGTFTGPGTGFLNGPPRVWAEQLAELTLTEGVSGYLLVGDDPDAIRRYAAEVVPAVRELVAAERATRPFDPGPATSGPTGTGAAPETGGDAARPAPEPGSAPGHSAGAGTRAVPATGTVAPGQEVRAGIRTSPFTVEPTPDDGTRLSDERVWDETTRPGAPAPGPGPRHTPPEPASRGDLLGVHDQLRAELTRLRDLVEQVAAGTMDPGAARSHINRLTMRQNNWTLGTFCESYCRIVTVHHTLEDVSVFPHLRHADPALAPVIDRLEQEHHVIHGVLDRVDRALVALVASDTSGGPDAPAAGSEPDGMRLLRAAVDLLTDTLLSHLSYEERQLVEPLARYGFS